MQQIPPLSNYITFFFTRYLIDSGCTKSIVSCPTSTRFREVMLSQQPHALGPSFSYVYAYLSFFVCCNYTGTSTSQIHLISVPFTGMSNTERFEIFTAVIDDSGLLGYDSAAKVIGSRFKVDRP
jgi:hypothetical protein